MEHHEKEGRQNTQRQGLSEFWMLLLTGAICAVIGAVLTVIIQPRLVKIQRVDQLQADKLNKLIGALRDVAVARDAAFASAFESNDVKEDQEAPHVKQYLEKVDVLCGFVDSDWKELPVLDERFRTELNGLKDSVCWSKAFLTSPGTRGIRANAYQFVQSGFLRDVARELEDLQRR